MTNVQKFDPVEKPEHYASGSLECKDWIMEMLAPEETEGWLKANALKYIWRYRDKGNPVQDIRKAIQYLEFLADFLEKDNAYESSDKLETSPMHYPTATDKKTVKEIVDRFTKTDGHVYYYNYGGDAR